MSNFHVKANVFSHKATVQSTYTLIVELVGSHGARKGWQTPWALNNVKHSDVPINRVSTHFTCDLRLG